jgi:hypothetical protein
MQDRHQKTLDAAPRGSRSLEVPEQLLGPLAQHAEDIARLQLHPVARQRHVHPHRIPAASKHHGTLEDPVVLGAIGRRLMGYMHFKHVRPR